MKSLEPKKTSLTIKDLMVDSIKTIFMAPFVTAIMSISFLIVAFISIHLPDSVLFIRFFMFVLGMIYLSLTIYDLKSKIFTVSSLYRNILISIKIMFRIKYIVSSVVSINICIIIYYLIADKSLTHTPYMGYLEGRSSVYADIFDYLAGLSGVTYMFMITYSIFMQHLFFYNDVILEKYVGHSGAVSDGLKRKAVELNSRLFTKIIFLGIVFIIPIIYHGLFAIPIVILYTSMITIATMDIWDVPTQQKEEQKVPANLKAVNGFS